MATFQIEMFSTTLKRLVPLTVILPVEKPDIPGIPKQEEKPFKTVYLLHGYSGSNNDWLYGSRIATLAMMHNVAVVMPSGGNSFYLDDEIRSEYMEKYITEELVAFTRKVFPLSAKKEDTTIGGLSMGGYGALHSALKRPDVFGWVYALSSAFITDQVAQMKEGDPNPIAPFSYYVHWFGQPAKVLGSDKDPKALAKLLKDSGSELPKIFMACGTEDFLLEPNRSMDQYFTQIGVAHEYRESKGVHNWAFWDEYIEKAMEWQYGKPQMGM